MNPKKTQDCEKQVRELQINIMQQSIINKVLQIGFKNISLEKQLQEIIDVIVQIPWFNTNNGVALFLVDPKKKDQLVLTAHTNFSKRLLKLCNRVDFGTCYCGRAAQQKMLQFTSCIGKHHDITYEGIKEHGHYCVPILSETEVLGVLNVYVSHNHKSEKYEQVFLGSVTSSIANIILRKNARKELEKHQLHLEELVVKRTEALEKSKEQFRYLVRGVESAAEAFIMTDPHGLIQYVNPAYTQLTGYSLEEVQGKNTNILKSGKHDPDFYKELWLTIRKGKVWSNEVLNKRKNGELFPATLAITPVFGRSKKIEGYVAIMNDISVQKETEAALKDSYKQLQALDTIKDEFVSIASHELRTPMTVIKTYTALLLNDEKQALDNNQKKYLNKIFGNTDRLIDLVNDMLDISKLEAGKMNFSIEAFPALDMLENIVAEYQLFYKGKNISLNLEYSVKDKKTYVMADKNKLHQVLVNLLSNAFKFTQENKKVLLRVTEQKGKGHFLQFDVEDSGIGIPKEKLKDIFTKFSQVEDHLSKGQSGTGLGLAIVKELIEQMGGTMKVKSTYKKGSCFSFTLPVKLNKGKQ